MTQAVVLAQQASTGVSPGFRNRIINGGMTIDQRNAGASVTNGATTTYTLDRWQMFGDQASKFSIQQVTTTMVGFTYALKVTSLSAYTLTTDDRFFYRQKIEGYNMADLNWGSANAKTVTLSFKAKSSLTGTFGGAIGNDDGTRSYPFTYTISSANTETSVSVTIPGPTSGTWLTTNGIGMTVNFGLGVQGSTYAGTAGVWANTNYYSATGAVSVVSTNGATLEITGVQLEVGSTATSFDYRSIGTELALCQRYFWVLTAAQGTAVSSTTARWNVSHPWMRASPTVAVTAALSVSDESTNDYTQSSGNISIQGNKASGGRYTGANFTGMTANRAANLLTIDGAIQFSSEL